MVSLDWEAFAFTCTKQQQTNQHVWNTYFKKKLLIVQLGEIRSKNMVKNMLCRINQWSVPHHFSIIAIIRGTKKLERNKPIAKTNGLICTVTLLQLKILKIDVSDVFQRNKGRSFSKKKLIETDMLNYKCSHIPNAVYLVPVPRLVKQNS